MAESMAMHRTVTASLAPYVPIHPTPTPTPRHNTEEFTHDIPYPAEAGRMVLKKHLLAQLPATPHTHSLTHMHS